MLLPELIKQILREQELTLSQLASQIGVTSTTLKKIVEGEVLKPEKRTREGLMKYCEMHNIDTSKLDWNRIVYNYFVKSRYKNEYEWCADADERGAAQLRHLKCGKITSVPLMCIDGVSILCIHCWSKIYATFDAYSIDLESQSSEYWVTHKLCGNKYKVSYEQLKQRKHTCPVCNGNNTFSYEEDINIKNNEYYFPIERDNTAENSDSVDDDTPLDELSMDDFLMSFDEKATVHKKEQSLKKHNKSITNTQIKQSQEERKKRAQIELERKEEKRLEDLRREWLSSLEKQNKRKSSKNENIKVELQQHDIVNTNNEALEQLKLEQQKCESLEAKLQEWKRVATEREQLKFVESERRERELIKAKNEVLEQLRIEQKARQSLDTKMKEQQQLAQERVEIESREREYLQAVFRVQKCLVSVCRKRERVEAYNLACVEFEHREHKLVEENSILLEQLEHERDRSKNLENELYKSHQMEILLHELNALQEKHICVVEKIQQNYKDKISAIIREIESIHKNIEDNRHKMDQVNILRFTEGKKLKAERGILEQKQIQLISELLKVYPDYVSQLEKENINYLESCSKADIST